MRKKAVPKISLNPFLKIGIFLVVVGVLAVFLFPRVVKKVLADHLSEKVGLPVVIRKLDFNLARPQFLMKDVKLFNPSGFPSSELAVLKEVKVNYFLPPIIVGRLEFQRIEINFKELRLIRNKTGRLNLPEPRVLTERPMAEVVLSLGPVTYTDLSEDQPVQKTFDLALGNALYRNVKGVLGILEIVNWEAIKRTGIDAKTPVIPEMKPSAAVPAKS